MFKSETYYTPPTYAALPPSYHYDVSKHLRDSENHSRVPLPHTAFTRVQDGKNYMYRVKVPLKSRHPITSDSLSKILKHILRDSQHLKHHGSPDYPKIGYFKEQNGTLLKQLNFSTYRFYQSPNVLPNFLFQ